MKKFLSFLEKTDWSVTMVTGKHQNLFLDSFKLINNDSHSCFGKLTDQWQQPPDPTNTPSCKASQQWLYSDELVNSSLYSFAFAPRDQLMPSSSSRWKFPNPQP